MGTIYSQVQVINASDIDNVQTTRIAEELDEQVKRLNDLLSALGDVYVGRISRMGCPTMQSASKRSAAVPPGA